MGVENRAYLKVIQYIKQLLLNNQLSIGDKLPTERELSELLELSRNSTREALRTMENMGMIESRQGSGNYLACNMGKSFMDSLTMMILMKRVDYLEISQLRRGIEIQALSLAMNKITDDELHNLELILNSMQECNQIQEVALDKEFHYALVIASKNELILNIMQALSEICEQFIDHILSKTLKNSKAELMKSHRKVLKSLVLKDLSMGIEAVNEHYNIIDTGLMNEKE